MYRIGSCLIIGVVDEERKGFVFIVLLCSIVFSFLIACSYASCGDLVSAEGSLFVMWAMNISWTHSSSLSRQSALDASST